MHFVFIVVAMFVSVSICISSFEALYSCAPKNENRFIISAFTSLFIALLLAIWLIIYSMQSAQYTPKNVYNCVVSKIDGIDTIVIDSNPMNLNALCQRSFEDGQHVQYTTYKHAKLYLGLSGNTPKKPTIEILDK